MATEGRKAVWLPNDLHEQVCEYANKYSLRHGKIVSIPEALIAILDEWDVMKDAQERDNVA